jgi:arylsulfatase
MQFIAQQLWLLVPIQGKIKEFFADFDEFPNQDGSSLNAGGINYSTLRAADALKRLKEMERFAPAN